MTTGGIKTFILLTIGAEDVDHVGLKTFGLLLIFLVLGGLIRHHLFIGLVDQLQILLIETFKEMVAHMAGQILDGDIGSSLHFQEFQNTFADFFFVNLGEKLFVGDTAGTAVDFLVCAQQ